MPFNDPRHASKNAGSASGQSRHHAQTPERLCIIVVSDHAHVTGGLAQVAHASAKGLSAHGHDVRFFAATAPVDPELAAAGVKVVCLNQQDMLGDPSAVRAAGRAIWNVRAGRALSAILATCDPRRSVVHLHGWSKALSPSVLHAARISGIASIQTLHDYVSVCPNGALYNYVQEANCTLPPMSARCVVSNCDARNYRHKLWRVARHGVLLASSRRAGTSAAIYMSERQREILASVLPPTVALHHVPNPVLADDLGPAPVDQTDVFSFIGRISREKGAVLMAKAARHAGVCARFVGDGPDRLAVQSAMPDARVTGWLPNAEVSALLRQTRALVFPSLWYETFGLTVHEALANGVPVIASDNTVSARLIQHGINGLLFRSGDVASLAEQLDRLKTPAFALKLGGAAYRRYWDHPPSLTRHIADLVHVYRKLLPPAEAGVADSASG